MLENKKDFDGWNVNKKAVNNKVAPLFWYEREVWWNSLGINIGHEQDGSSEDYSRPVLILRKLSHDTCIIMPLTTSKNIHKYRPSIGIFEGEENKVVLTQMKVIDSRRLLKKIGTVNLNIFNEIRKIARELL
ncbi:MAG TPA: type II toxin-antitoxin system PemK/MazF family toxin [Candidatus Paceibacterota bacterium]